MFAELGDFEKARQYQEEALAIRHTVLGENHPDTALSLSNMGYLLTKQSQYVAARSYLEQALLVFEKLLGSKHHVLVNVFFNLATVMLHLKLYPKAREYGSRAMKICQEAKDRYKECEKIKQLQNQIPMEIGRKKQEKKKRGKK